MSALTYGSVCSGIEAASVAWHPLGWQPVFLSEIEAFPRAVLRERWPDAPLHGDFTTIQRGEYADIDLLVGGTPCQSFSIAGLRKGMADERGNLALEFLRLAARLGPRWLVWENVPGVLSSNGGRDFGAFLGGLAELGYGFAYRVLDAQYIRVDGYARAVPQRRRRVFVVGHLGDWRRAAAVLFERESLSGHPAPRREAGQSAPTIPGRSTAGGGLSTDFDCDGGLIANALTASDHKGVGHNRDDNVIASCVPTCFRNDPTAETLIAVDTAQMTSKANRSHPRTGDPCHPLTAGAHAPTIATTIAVRRLTPTECEALQGFPRGYTLITYRGKPAADGPRYKAMGNSMACNVMRWIGRRIQLVQQIVTAERAA